MMIKRSALENVRAVVIDPSTRTASENLNGFDFEPDPDGGYLYVTARALTSDVPNLNYDMFPHEEMKTAYESFKGCPVYVEHHNTDLDRARGVILDAKYHDEDPDDRWTEILMEMDEETFPKLCSMIRSGELDTMSMGCEIQGSTCSVCGNYAEDMSQFCNHIKQKGASFGGTAAYEICSGIEFIEESWVYTPADPTAMTTAKRASMLSMKRAGSLNWEFDGYDRWTAFGPGDSEFCVQLYEEDDDGQCEAAVWGANGDYLGHWWVDSAEEGKRLLEEYYAANAYLFERDEKSGSASKTASVYRIEVEIFGNDVEEYYDGRSYETLFKNFIVDANSLGEAEQKVDSYCNSTYGYDYIGITGQNIEEFDSYDDYRNEYPYSNAERIAQDVHVPDRPDPEGNAGTCPICDNPGFDGTICDICGYTEFPEGFGPIDTESVIDMEQNDDADDKDVDNEEGETPDDESDDESDDEIAEDEPSTDGEEE